MCKREKEIREEHIDKKNKKVKNQDKKTEDINIKWKWGNQKKKTNKKFIV